MERVHGKDEVVGSNPTGGSLAATDSASTAGGSSKPIILVTALGVASGQLTIGDVAQLVRASACQVEGRRFEAGHLLALSVTEPMKGG